MNKWYNQTGKSGSIKWIILIIIAIVVASYFFDFDVQDAVEDEQTQSNFNYLKTEITEFYDNYIREYAEVFWEFITTTFQKIMAGESSGIEDLAPTIEIE